MPDLHDWITQQVADRAQLAELISPGGYAPDEWRIEPSRSGRWVEIVAYSRTNIEPPEAASREQAVALTQTGRNEHLLIAMHDPASVLRRCAADRKILAAHPYTSRVINPSDGSTSAGFGCETCHDWDGVPEGRGNCATILAVAEAYELTPEILTTLDRPEV